MMQHYETWVEINLQALAHNLDIINKRIPNSTNIIGVIKGNAYGHDAVIIARALLRLGVRRLAVASINEGISLRKAGLKDCSIHILGSLHPDCAARAVQYDFINTICTLDSAEALLRVKQRPLVHVNIDLGMNRVGCEPNELDQFIKVIEQRGVVVEGLYGHLPDVLVSAQETDRQIQLFCNLTDKYKGRYLRHLANSPGLFRDEGKTCAIPFDFIRVGSALYGNVQRGFHSDADKLLQLLSWKVKPTRIQRVFRGESIGYSRVYVAQQDCWVATLPVGYVDGVPFEFSSHLRSGKVKLGDDYCDIVGKICMDHLMVKIPYKITLDSVFDIIVADLDAHVNSFSLARQLRTTSTDIIAGIHPRVQRIGVHC